MSETLYEKLGGEKTVDAAVDIFYQKVLADPHINQFLKGVEMVKQGRMQKNFLTFAFGGPHKYDGRNMLAAHSKLVAKGLNDSHFNTVASHLVSTLQELDVAQVLIDEVAVVAESGRNDALGNDV